MREKILYCGGAPYVSKLVHVNIAYAIVAPLGILILKASACVLFDHLQPVFCTAHVYFLGW